jgi:hypothetical protein
MILKAYKPISPMIQAFHQSDEQVKCIVGAVGTGKTTAAIWEVGFNLPRRIYERWGITHTRWVVVRKTFEQLMDTDWVEATDWFLQGKWHAQKKLYTVKWPASENCGSSLTVDLIFHSCNTPEEEGKFRSMNLTGAWIDEANQIPVIVKNIIKGRLGRYPKRREVESDFVPRYMIETCNPFPSDDPMYTMYDWVGPQVVEQPLPEVRCAVCEKNYSGTMVCPECGREGELTGRADWRSGVYDTNVLVRKLPPGPVPAGVPTKNHVGFWQEAGENEENLRQGYWDAIRNDYKEAPEMVALLVEGKPGYKPEGKPVYRNYNREVHMSKAPLIWKQMRDSYTGELRGVPLLVGWDNTGDAPAAVVCQKVGPMSYQVLKEFHDDRMGIIDFTKHVLETLQTEYPGYEGVHYCDPAGFSQQSDSRGGLTSNADLQREICGIAVAPSRQELDLRISAIDQLLARRDGLLIDLRCSRLLNGFFGGYVREENVRMGINEYKAIPKKNKFSHIHDALQYALVIQIYPKVKEPRPDIAEDEDLIASYPPALTADSYGARNAAVRRAPVEVVHSQRAETYDPRRQQ